MLVIKRKIKEEIVLTHESIEEPIVLSLQKVSGSYAKIGIEASEDVRIIRSELLDKET